MGAKYNKCTEMDIVPKMRCTELDHWCTESVMYRIGPNSFKSGRYVIWGPCSRDGFEDIMLRPKPKPDLFEAKANDHKGQCHGKVVLI